MSRLSELLLSGLAPNLSQQQRRELQKHLGILEGTMRDVAQLRSGSSITSASQVVLASNAINASGNLNIDAKSPSAHTTVYIKNSDGTYQADLNVEKNIVVGGTVDGVDVSALDDPQYLTLAASATLANERVFTPGDGLDGTDGGAGLNYTLAVDVTDILGAGLTETDNNIVVGAGDGIDVGASSVAVDVTDLLGTGLDEDLSNNLVLPTPGTLSVSSSNAAAAPHTHGITTSSNPGAAANILATDANGKLAVVMLGIGTNSYGNGNGVVMADDAWIGNLYGGIITFNDTDDQVHITGAARGFGVNTDNPGRMLEALDASNPQLRLTKTAASVYTDFQTDANGDLVITPTGGDIFIAANIVSDATDSRDLGTSTNLWRKGWLSELDAILFAQNTISVFGNAGLIAHGEGTLGADVAAVDTTIDFGTNNVAENDFVLLRGNGQAEYVQVGTVVSGNVWNVTRNKDGSGANAWPAGHVYVNQGYDGDGRIELDSINTPRISLLTQGTTYNGTTEHIRIGDLNGNWGYSSETWGAAFGQYGASQNNITVDATNGIRMRNNTATVFQVETDGDVVFGNVATNQGNMLWDNTAKQLKFRGGTNGTAVQAYVDTDGSLVWSGGYGKLNANGIKLTASTAYDESRGYLFTNGTNVNCAVYSKYDSVDNILELAAFDMAGRDSFVGCYAQAPTTYEANAAISGQSGNNLAVVWAVSDDNAVNWPTDFIWATPTMFIGENTTGNSWPDNTKMTQGLTINQGANDDEILALKSSDVAHGATDFGETDTYEMHAKYAATTGGALIRGLAESAATIGVGIQGVSGTANTTRSTSGVANVMLEGYKYSGTSIANADADQNIVAFRTYKGSAFATTHIFDEDGDIQVDGSATVGTYDEYDDVKLLTAIRAEVQPAGSRLREQFKDWMEYARPILQDSGIITYNDDGHHFVSLKGMWYLTIDAVRQIAGRMERYERALLSAGIDPNLLEA